MTRRDLRSLFAPSAVCVVGASSDPGSISGRPARILQRHGFSGGLFLVNPKRDEIDGVPCFPSVGALPSVPDVAIIVLKAPLVPDVLDQCGARGIKNVIVISSGFEEDDTADDLVRRMRTATRAHGLNLVGPNSEGIWGVPGRAMLTFGSAAMRDEIALGPVSVISQSGSIGGNVAKSLQERGVGCRYFVSSGNESDLGVADYIDFFVDDGGTEVVALFLEGLTDGRRFLESLRRARAKGIRFVALKAGSSEIGAMSAASHTGKLASSAHVFTSVFRQNGVLEVGSIGDLVEAAEFLTMRSMKLRSSTGAVDRRRGIAIVAPGATRTVMADAAERLGVPLAEFGEETVARLGTMIPSFGYAMNPVDVTAQVSTQGLFDEVLEIMGSDDATDALFVQWGNRGLHRVDEIRATAASVAKATDKPVFVGFLGEEWELGSEVRKAFYADGIACAASPDVLLKRASWAYRERAFPPAVSTVDAGTSRGERSVPDIRTVDDAAALTAGAGFIVPRQFELLRGTSASEAQAALIAAGITYPVAVKASADEVQHKVDRGLVRLDVVDAEGVLSQAAEMFAANPDLTRLVVQEMARSGLEVLVTLRDDRDFGPMLTVGWGGELVELLGDAVHLTIPFTREALTAGMSTLKVSDLLDGYRGRPAADVEGLLDAITRLADDFLALEGRVSTIEMNPVIVGPVGVGAQVVDILVELAQ